MQRAVFGAKSEGKRKSSLWGNSRMSPGEEDERRRRREV